MNRIRVRESVGGNRLDADDNDPTDKETDAMDFKKQLFDEADEREAETRRMLTGDFEPRRRAGDVDLKVSDSDTTGVSARDAYFAREAAMSRHPATGAGSGIRVSAADLEVDDDETTTSATGSAREANLDRELRRSRQPAGAR